VSGAPKVADRVVSNRSDLVAHIASGEKPPEAWRVGTEHEKIGVYEDTLERVPYEGENGIRGLLEEIARNDGWSSSFEGDNLVALEKDGASITLEPGGQLELSGAPLRTVHETCDEFHRHLHVVREASRARGIVWLSVGIDPKHGVAAVPQVPKERYGIMRAYLPSRGELALHMMHVTATVQANFDFEDEPDMVRKMRMASGVSPIVSALFANSSLAEGKSSGYVSRRVHIWQDTDPDRCGLLPFVFEPGFGYERYVEWALDVPMFFRLLDGRYEPMHGKPFRTVLEGDGGPPATLLDFELHLTTLFPEVRLKRFIEVRGADAVPSGLICALPALWKGLLYDREALDAAWDLVSAWPFAERVASIEEVARRGLAATICGAKTLDLAGELVEIAAGGLQRIGHAGAADPDESGYLNPLREVLASGKSPGQALLERWEGPWNRSFEKLIEFARF
jgi:glutamate--cysteine ligase